MGDGGGVGVITSTSGTQHREENGGFNLRPGGAVVPEEARSEMVCLASCGCRYGSCVVTSRCLLFRCRVSSVREVEMGMGEAGVQVARGSCWFKFSVICAAGAKQSKTDLLTPGLDLEAIGLSSYALKKPTLYGTYIRKDT